MAATRWVTACLCVVACFGCSSSEFQTAPADDAGATDTGIAPTDSTTTDGRPLCIVPPAATGSESAFCNFESKVYSRCGQCEDCRQTNENGCVQFGGALSASFKQALVECQDVLACGEYASYVSDKCMQPKIAAAVPTAEQKAAKDAYCAACPTNTAECAGFFDLSSFTGMDAGADAGTNKGIGWAVMISSDDIAKQIATDCKGGLNCNPYVYQYCASQKFCNRTPPDACNKGFCGK